MHSSQQVIQPPGSPETLDTVRTLREARAAKSLPARERESRERSLKNLEELSLEERLRLYKRVHAAKKAIAQRVTDAIQSSMEADSNLHQESTSRREQNGHIVRPKTPREVDEEVDAVGRRALDDIVAAERKEEQLVMALRKKLATKTTRKKLSSDCEDSEIGAASQQKDNDAIAPAKQKSGLFGKLLSRS
jgi:hypothetical protein